MVIQYSKENNPIYDRRDGKREMFIGTLTLN